jgi:hypothetical protein
MEDAVDNEIEHDSVKEDDDDEFVASVQQRGLALANAAKFIAAKQPDVKEAVLILVETAVDNTISLTNPDEVVSELADQFDIDRKLAHDIVANLVAGEPKAGPVVRKVVELLATPSSTAPVSPSTPTASDSTVTDAILAGIKALSPTKSTLSDPNAMISISDAREQILAIVEPNYRVEMDEEIYGLYAVKNPAFAPAIRNAPMDRVALVAKALLGADAARRYINKGISAKTSWPSLRYSLVGEMDTTYGHYTGMQLIQGSSAAVARTAGLVEVGSIMLNAISTIPDLSAQLAESIRNADKTEVAKAVIIAVDSACSPSMPYAEFGWVTLAPTPGESTLDCFRRVRKMAASLGKPWPAALERLNAILFVLQADNANAGNIRAHLESNAIVKAGADETERVLKMNALYLQPLVSAGRGRERQQGANTLIIKGAQGDLKFYDISLGLEAYEKAAGRKLCNLPPSGTAEACVFCEHFGVEFIDYDQARITEVRNAKGKLRFKHNPWGCACYPEWVGDLCGKYPELKKDDLVRLISNPREVAKAKGV